MVSIGERRQVDPTTISGPIGERAVCLDCGAALHGACCSECGQRVRDPNPTIGDLMGEAWGAFADVDGRVLSTLRMLVLHPGALALEFIRGRRTRYLTPFRLYLLAIFALLLAMAYRSRRLRYPVHLVMALHLHAFGFAATSPDHARNLLLPGSP